MLTLTCLQETLPDLKYCVIPVLYLQTSNEWKEIHNKCDLLHNRVSDLSLNLFCLRIPSNGLDLFQYEIGQTWI